MEVVLGSAVLILFVWAVTSYGHDRKFNKLFKERTDVEKEKLFVERCKHQFMVRRWEEHKQLRGLSDFKMKKLKAVADEPLLKEEPVAQHKPEPLVPFMDKFRDLTKGTALKTGLKKPTVSSTLDH